LRHGVDASFNPVIYEPFIRLEFDLNPWQRRRRNSHSTMRRNSTAVITVCLCCNTITFGPPWPWPWIDLYLHTKFRSTWKYFMWTDI